MARHPMNDVIVVVPGIMGSTLHRDGKPIWEPSRGAIVSLLSSVFRSVTSLTLPDGVGDGHPGDGVKPVALMPDLRLPLGLWTFDLGYSALVAFLRTTFAIWDVAEANGGPANLVLFPYDWRLSNRYNGCLLGDVAERALMRWREQGHEYEDAKLVFIAHSMGGLVARWYVDRLGGSEVTRRLITIGTPHRGAVNALDQLCNGVRKGPGPFKVNLTLFARSLPSVHQLLPEYAAIEDGTGLQKTTEVRRGLPELDSAMVADAMTFHSQLDAGRAAGTTAAYTLHPISGFRQPTFTSARIDGNQVVALNTILGDDVDGDATVPRLAAVPPDVPLDGNSISHVASNHGGLVHNQGVFDHIEGILTASPVRYEAAPEVPLTVNVPEVLNPGEALVARARTQADSPATLEAEVRAVDGTTNVVRLHGEDDWQAARVSMPDPGVYTVTVRGAAADRFRVVPIKTAVLAWPPDGVVTP